MKQRDDMTADDLLIRLDEVGPYETKKSRVTGVSRRTLKSWWENMTEEERHDYLRRAKEHQEAFWQEIHDRALQVASSKIRELSPKDAIVCAAISYDKLALIRGQATTNIGTIAQDAETLVREVEEILGKVLKDAPKKSEPRSQ